MSFNADDFMAGTMEGSNSTVRETIPTGEYLAVINKIDAKEETSKKTGKPFHIMDITWSIQDDKLRMKLDRDEVFARQSLFIDVTPEGKLDMSKGKNVDLGKLREALSQNDPGRQWSPMMLNGAGPATVKIKHRPNPDDPDNPYVEVKGVTKG